MKENDYLLANLLNPDFNNQDYKDILGMNAGNTQLLPYSSYASNPFITSSEKFKDDNGNFSEGKFKEFYTDSLQKFQSFNDDNPLVDNLEYSMFDTSRRRNSRVKDPGFRFTTISNPDRVSTGIGGRNKQEESPFSSRELAQQSKVWDTKKQEWRDYSPNDNAFTKSPVKWIKSLFDDPLVKATWDSEGDHRDPVTGELKHHVKGQEKLNDEGQYYYETLGGRSTMGKEVLSAFDTITVDGEGLNKYDFLDSDDLDKSTSGTIAKAALAVAPLFLGGPASMIYSGALIAREMSKSLPMLYGMVSSLVGNDNDSPTLNKLAAYADKLTTSNSDYAQHNTFAFENIASLMGDVATQWGQLKAIAQSISKLRGTSNEVELAYKRAAQKYAVESLKLLASKDPSALAFVGDPLKWQESALGRGAIKDIVNPVIKMAEKHNRLGADASLAYMAIISNTDVYESMLEHGASKRDAAAVAFGSTLGMFGVDKYLGLGEVFFDELRNEERLALRGSLKKESEALAKELFEGGTGIKTATKDLNKALKLILQGMKFSKNIVTKYADDLKNHTTGFFGKALGEGLEEVGEEVVTDLSKQIYQLAGEFSPNIINLSGITDVGAWENAKERYLMSLLGGALGGGLFYGVNVVQSGTFKRDNTKDDLIYLISNGKTAEVLNELEDWRKKGKLGSTTRSATQFEYNKDGDPVYLTAANEADSQNQFVYDKIKDSITQLETILKSHGANLGEDDLFKLMVLSERRFMNLKDVLQEQSYVTRYQLSFRDVTKKIVETEQGLSRARMTKEGTADGTIMSDAEKSDKTIVENSVRLENIAKIEEELSNLKELLKSFSNGEYSLHYTDKMLFAIDPFLNRSFVTMDYATWLKETKNKAPDLLSEAEREVFKKEYLDYKKVKLSFDLDKGFELYKNGEKLISPHIQALAENAENFRKVHDALWELFTAEDSPYTKFELLDLDEKLEWETDEEFANRNKLLDGETNDEFRERKDARTSRIKDYNDQLIQTLKDNVLAIIDKAGGHIDPSTLRFLHNSLKLRRKDRFNGLVAGIIHNTAKTVSPAVYTALSSLLNLDEHLTNIDEIGLLVENIIKEFYKNEAEEASGILGDSRESFKALLEDFGYDSENLNGKVLSDFFEDLAERILDGDPDVKDKFHELRLDDYYNSLLSSDDIKRDLMTYKYMGDNLLDLYIGSERDPSIPGEFIDEEQWGSIAGMIDSYGESFNMERLTPDELQATIDRNASADIDYAKRLMSDIQYDTLQDPYISMLDEIDARVTKDNPVTQFLSLTKIALDPEGRSIEEILQAISDRFLNGETIEDFTLSESEELAIKEASDYLQVAKAYLYAAATNGRGYSTPVGHNKIINEFAKNHSKIFPDFLALPELDEDVASMYISEIEKYQTEMDPDSPTSWVGISNENKINKRKKFIITESKFNDAKAQLLDLIKDSDRTKFIINGKSYDLLEGAETVTDDDVSVRVHKLENIFYKNVLKALNDGLSFEDILRNTLLLEGIMLDASLQGVVKLHTASLDDSINYGKLTDFDKFTYLLTIAGVSSNEFANFIKTGIEADLNLSEEEKDKRKVPLTIQEWTSRVAIAQIKNKELYLSALKYLKDKTGTSTPILTNVVFIDGSAGVGKSSVIAKNAARYLDSEDVWLTAPEQDLRDNLRKAVGKGTVISRSDLFGRVIDPSLYTEIMTAAKTTGRSNYFTVLPSGGNNVITINTDKITFNDVQDPPKLIIIDEVTHFSGIELLILNEFAKRKGINIITLGDTNQNGFTGAGRNIDREFVFAIRSPKLSISLRDVNLLKLENLIKVQKIMNSMQALDDDSSSYNNDMTVVTSAISNINFLVYNEDVLNGDLLTQTLTTDLVDKMFGDVVFVGDTNGDAYQALMNHGDLIKSVKVLTPLEIQGQEFDFIVVDLNWTMGNDPVDKLDFLTNLYTLMSRGKVGSIFIDKGLSNIIGLNVKASIKTLAPNIKDGIDDFVNAKVETLEKLGLIPNSLFELEMVPTSGTTGSTTNTGGNGSGGNPNTGGSTNTGGNNNASTNGATSGNNSGTNPSGQTGNTGGSTTGSTGGTNNQATGGTNANLNTGGTSGLTNQGGSNNAGLATPPGGSPTPPAGSTNNNFNPVTTNTNTEPPTEELTAFIETLESETPDETLAVFDWIKEQLEDDTDEVAEREENRVDLDSLEMRVYGSAHFSGLIREEVLGADNKKVVKYSMPNTLGDVKTDLQIFMKNQSTSSGTEIDSMVRALLNIKSVLLYKKDTDLLSQDVFDAIGSDAKEAIENAEYKIEIRPGSETDNFIGFTGLESDGEDGNNPLINGLVYTVVAEFKNKAGLKFKVTLGLLANPDSYTVSPKLSESEQLRVKDKILKYREYFDKMTLIYRQEGQFYRPINVTMSGLTALRRTTGVGSNKKPVKIRTLESFKNLKKYSVISSPYIFTGADFVGLKDPDKFRGKAVVFVSNDTTLSPDELMQLYIDLKTERARNNSGILDGTTTPSVRMIKLEPVGVPFRSLTFSDKLLDLWKSTITINGEKVIKMFPFEEDFMGVRMYASLWNYRANLSRFLTKVQRFQWLLSDGTILTSEDIDRIARYADAKYASEHKDSTGLSDSAINSALANPATDEELALLKKFNDSLASEVRLFRIGGSFSESGVYLRELTNISADNIFYKDLGDTPIGIYITLEKAKLLYNMLNVLLNTTFAHIRPLRATKWDASGKAIEFEDFDETRLISAKDGFRNSIANKTAGALTGAVINMEEGGEKYTLRFPPDHNNLFDQVPVVLAKAYTYLYKMSMDDEYEPKPLTYGKDDDKITYSYSEILKYMKPGFGGEPDYSLDDLLALVFHGTTAVPNIFFSEPSSKENTGKEKYTRLRATDAYFKHGIFIDPLAGDVEGTTSGGEALFRKCQTNEKLFTVDVEADMPIFTVSLLDMNKAIYNPEEEAAQPVSNVDPYVLLNALEISPAELEDEINEIASQVSGNPGFSLRVHKMLNNYYYTEVRENLMTHSFPGKIMILPLTTSYGTNYTYGKVTVLEYLERKVGKSFDGADMSWKDGNIEVSLKDGSEIIVIRPSNSAGRNGNFENLFEIERRHLGILPEAEETNLGGLINRELKKLTSALLVVEDLFARVNSNPDYKDIINSYDADELFEEFQNNAASYGIKNLRLELVNLSLAVRYEIQELNDAIESVGAIENDQVC